MNTQESINLALSVEPSINSEINPKGIKMEIFHYLMSTVAESEIPATRIITNNPSQAAREAVIESEILHGRPVEIASKVEDAHVFAMHVNTGTYTFPLLIERAIKMGIKFRIASFSNEAMALKSADELLRMLAKSNFAWATASASNFVVFEGCDDWGLEILGMKVENCKKLTKRLTELMRCTNTYVYCIDGSSLTIREFTTPELDSDIFYDGGNAISEQLARRLGFKGTRGNIRVMTPMGLIKGDCQVIKGLDADVVFHTENLKPELSTTGWVLVTIMDHPPLHDVRHDDQSRGNFNFFLTEEIVRGDINAMVASYKESISEGGELHNYLSNASTCFDDPIAVDLDVIQLADTLEKQAEMLKSIGIPSASFSNIPYTHLGAITRKMEAHKIEDTDIHKRLFIPARNAFLGSVSTYEFCTKLCGMVFPNEDGSRTFFDSRVGLVIPGKRFEDTYDLHGGHDGDDTWAAYEIKVFCSDPARLEGLIEDKVVDPNLVIGATADEAVTAGLMIRRPNAAGEYSIESVSEDMPWMNRNEATIGTFDLANAPLSQKQAFANVNKGDLKLYESVNFSGSYDKEAALTAIQAQMINPGVGTFANVLMCWAQTFGCDVLPSSMIAGMEDVVDALQQTADPMVFMAISEDVKEMWIDFRDTVISTGTKVDPCLLVSRIPEKVGSGKEKEDIGIAIAAAGLVEKGQNSRIQKRYNAAIAFLKELSMTTANETRNGLKLAETVRGMSFDPELMEFAVRWLSMANGRLRGLTNAHRDATPKDANAIVRRQLAYQKRVAMEGLMDTLVNGLVTNEKRDTHQAVLAMYKWITTGREKFPTGDIDRIFVQPSSEGETSMLQLFIEAASMAGLLDDF